MASSNTESKKRLCVHLYIGNPAAKILRMIDAEERLPGGWKLVYYKVRGSSERVNILGKAKSPDGEIFHLEEEDWDILRDFITEYDIEPRFLTQKLLESVVP